MNSSISHLSEDKQEELNTVIEFIREEVPETQMIILFGSYATGDYVEYDQRTEYGLRTTFQSDFDLLVLTPKKKASYNSIMRRLNNAASKFYKWRFIIATPVQFVNMSVEEFNKAIHEGRYFFTEILKTGILLYNSGDYELETERPLNFEQILKLSQEYYDEKYGRAESFYRDSKYAFSNNDYRQSAFYLHQAAENYVIAINLTASLYSPKGHNLYTIFNDSKMFTDKAVLSFPLVDEEDKRLFELLNNSYVQARYNKDFVVTKEDIEKLSVKMENLRVNSKAVCEEKISEHTKRLN